jgi:hypothetical protein
MHAPAISDTVIIADTGCLADREVGELVEISDDPSDPTPYTVEVTRNDVTRRYDCAAVERVTEPEGWGKDKAPAGAPKLLPYRDGRRPA